MKRKTFAILGLALFAFFFALQFGLAMDFNQTLSASDKQAYDTMLAPVLSIYNLVKYTASVIAVVMLLFAGVNYIMSAGDPAKREQSKNMAMYVIIGLIVIWAAPLIVQYIVR